MVQKHGVHDDQNHEEEKERERDLVVAYVAEHALEATLNDVINQMVVTRPEDPFLMLSSLLYARATAKRGISFVQVNEVIDAMGEPTVLVRLLTGKGVFEGCCSAEAGGVTDRDCCKTNQGLDDNSSDVCTNKLRYDGRGFTKIAATAQELLTAKLVGKEPTEQNTIDSILQDLETTLGRNVCLATSLALCQAGARYAELSLRDYVSNLQELAPENQCVPMPLFSIVNGGRYASNQLFAQEVIMTPTSAVSFADALQIAVELHTALKAQLHTYGIGFTNCGAFGGFAPPFQSLKELFHVLHAALNDVQERLEDPNGQAISSASATPLLVDFGVDFAASEFGVPFGDYSPDSDRTPRPFTYNTDQWVPGSSGVFKTSEELLDIIHNSVKELKLTTVVDPFDAGDIKSFAALFSTENDTKFSDEAAGTVATEGGKDGVAGVIGLGGDPNCRIQIVGRAIVERHGLTVVSEEHACNTVLLMPHKFSTISRLLQAITNARSLGLAVILGVTAGQFGDADVLVALAIGAGIGQVKFGGVFGAESQNRYRKLLLESQEPEAPPFVASAFRR